MVVPVSDTRAMIAGMDPVLDDAVYVFCSLPACGTGTAGAAVPLAMFMEDEGISMVLRADDANAHDLEKSPPMRRITMSVHSSLDGVGLTAAVSGALAEAGIACNVIAAFHHDHLFVPAGDAEKAMQVLLDLQTGTNLPGA